jgi:hypothetical protein
LQQLKAAEGHAACYKWLQWNWLDSKDLNRSLQFPPSIHRFAKHIDSGSGQAK